MDEIDRIRELIDGVDDRLLHALSDRRKLTNEIIEVKIAAAGDRPLRDLKREEELLGRLVGEGRKIGLDAHFVTRVFHEIIDDSIRTQELLLQSGPAVTGDREMRVAYPGIEGAYSHLAAQKYFAGRAETQALQGLGSLNEVVAAVQERRADYGIFPIENTTAGSINPAYDLLLNARLSIVGEELLRVEHCLLGLSTAPLGTIRRIVSHPQALAQCMRFLSRLQDVRTESFADTARAVRRVRDDGDATQAAIGSEDAARRYGLVVLQRDIADQRDNFTRFLVVAREPVVVDRRIPAKTSLVMAISHEEGALLRALNILGEHHINMTKLESRPRPGTPFQYLFYVDFEGNREDPRVTAAMDDLSGATTFLKVLGTYPSHGRARVSPSARVVSARNGVKPTEAAAMDTVASEPASHAKAPADPKAVVRAKSKVAYKLVSRENRSEDTVIDVRGVRIGGPAFVVMAGPCAVESREQILACAHQVRESGGRILRGGCFKPRTSPYSFQGLGYEGLAFMAEAGRKYDLPIITEVLTAEDVEGVAEQADILQIGARNMQNFSLLRAAGRSTRPVMLKRGMSATIDEFLNAAEYIMAQGNHQVILCERGIRTFETSTRNTLDLASIPLLKRMTHLPIIVDPSHAAGKREYVAPLAIAAHAVGPHGIMVEIHPNPAEALSDGPQALLFTDFAELMERIAA